MQTYIDYVKYYTSFFSVNNSSCTLYIFNLFITTHHISLLFSIIVTVNSYYFSTIGAYIYLIISRTTVINVSQFNHHM